jgi:hypothetical protein
MKKATPIIHALALLPLCVALGHLVAVPVFEWYPMHPVLSLTPLFLLVLAPVLVHVSASIATQHARILGRLAALSPCWLAPLAILNAWTLAPGFPYAYGGYGFFLHWLTKYPNFGPINLEVFLGIVCVLLSSLLPAVFASYAITQRPRRLAVLALVALELPCLVAVIINLDFGLLLAGFTILSPTHFMGPVLRLAGAVAMCAATVPICLRKTEQSHGEASRA